eukprot:PhM_4_TR14681/c2_g1_i1/m.16618
MSLSLNMKHHRHDNLQLRHNLRNSDHCTQRTEQRRDEHDRGKYSKHTPHDPLVGLGLRHRRRHEQRHHTKEHAQAHNVQVAHQHKHGWQRATRQPLSQRQATRHVHVLAHIHGRLPGVRGVQHGHVEHTLLEVHGLGVERHDAYGGNVRHDVQAHEAQRCAALQTHELVADAAGKQCRRAGRRMGTEGPAKTTRRRASAQLLREVLLDVHCVLTHRRDAAVGHVAHRAEHERLVQWTAHVCHGERGVHAGVHEHSVADARRLLHGRPADVRAQGGAGAAAAWRCEARQHRQRQPRRHVRGHEARTRVAARRTAVDVVREVVVARAVEIGEGVEQVRRRDLRVGEELATVRGRGPARLGVSRQAQAVAVREDLLFVAPVHDGEVVERGAEEVPGVGHGAQTCALDRALEAVVRELFEV